MMPQKKSKRLNTQHFVTEELIIYLHLAQYYYMWSANRTGEYDLASLYRGNSVFSLYLYQPYG